MLHTQIKKTGGGKDTANELNPRALRILAAVAPDSQYTALFGT